MKTLSLTILITFLTFNSLFAQSGWHPVDSTMNQASVSVFFTDANTGYAAGYTYPPSFHSTLRKTTNAGVSWFSLPIPPADTVTNIIFRSIFFTDANTGFIAGGNSSVQIGNGFVLKTTNGGNSWSPLTLPVYNLYNHVYFINSSTGYVGGVNSFIKTTDGGTSWFSMSPIYSIGYYQICFTDVNTGYVVGNNGNIFKTTNGGNYWNTQYSGTTVHLWGINFADANTGIVAGGTQPPNQNNVILRTTNGGNNWNTVQYNNTTCLLWSVRFISPSVGYVIGWCNQILKTTDGGANWCSQISPVNSNLRDVFFTNSNTGYLFGDPISNQYGYILKTTDGGGNCIPVGIEPVTNEIPAQFNLYQNYPNPFNPSTKIKFSLPKSSFAKLLVYDILGKEVVTLVNEQLNAGSYEVEWNAGNYPSGTYFYKLTSENYSEIKKMVLVK